MKQVISKDIFMERLPGPRKGVRNGDIQRAIDYLEERSVTVAPCKYVLFTKNGSLFLFENDEALTDYVERERSNE